MILNGSHTEKNYRQSYLQSYVFSYSRAFNEKFFIPPLQEISILRALRKHYIMSLPDLA